MTWDELSEGASGYRPSLVHGPANSQAQLRLFGTPESAVRVTLFKDAASWCPYCEKVWLWLEEKRIPYRVRKVPLSYYGEPEKWYRDIVSSGIVPALEIKDEEKGGGGRLITESEVILATLEDEFGPLGTSRLEDIPKERGLESKIFERWISWLSNAGGSGKNLQEPLERFEERLGDAGGPFLLGDHLSIADVIFVPTMERLAASLYYYKGWTLRDPELRPNTCRWLDALETRESYMGIKGDFHTIAHSIPAQLGGCYKSGDSTQRACAKKIDGGSLDTPDTALPEPKHSREEAVYRMVLHRHNLIAVAGRATGTATKETIDYALRCALTSLFSPSMPDPLDERGADKALHYIADRICVPRDMSIWASRRLRKALKAVAAKAGSELGPAIPRNHRRDQSPARFFNAITFPGFEAPREESDDLGPEESDENSTYAPAKREDGRGRLSSSLLAVGVAPQAIVSSEKSARRSPREVSTPFLHGSLFADFEERSNSAKEVSSGLREMDRGLYHLSKMG